MAATADAAGSKHYKGLDPKLEHWNLVSAYGWDYFTGCATKYLFRWRKKGGVEDLKKARHFIDKLIELVEAETPPAETPTTTVAFKQEERQS